MPGRSTSFRTEACRHARTPRPSPAETAADWWRSGPAGNTRRLTPGRTRPESAGPGCCARDSDRCRPARETRRRVYAASVRSWHIGRVGILRRIPGCRRPRGTRLATARSSGRPGARTTARPRTGSPDSRVRAPLFAAAGDEASRPRLTAPGGAPGRCGSGEADRPGPGPGRHPARGSQPRTLPRPRVSPPSGGRSRRYGTGVFRVAP